MSTYIHFLFLFLFLSTSHHFTLSSSSSSSSSTTLPPASATPVTPTTACNSTSDPTFCKSILNPQGSRSLSTYSLFSISKSLSNARKFQTLVNRYLSRQSSLSISAVRALQDCHLLASLNIDFLTAATSTLNSTAANSAPLLDPQTDQLQTLLSALLTNQQTCIDGLKATSSAWSVKNGLSVPLSDGSKLYSVSLALFTRAWVPKTKKTTTKKKKEKKPKLPPMMLMGRRLIQSEGGEDGDEVDQVMVSDVVVVSKDGLGNFSTISDAVNSAPNNTDGSNGYYLIYVNEGVYEEYVVIPKYKKYVMMIGDGINRTVITGNHNNIDGWTTFNSATFAVVGQGFVGMNMTMRNTAGPSKHQAVALRNGADLSTFYTCSFEGYQDTLYAHSMRQFFRDCDIYGTVDFIFGNAAVVFQDCNIYSRLPMPGQSNTITAQGRTDPYQNTGTSIQNCNFVAAHDLAVDNGSTITYLGRPWKEFSRTVIMNSFMDSSITPVGWLPWNGTFALDTLYYVEFNNSGPGSSTDKRVPWPGYHTDFNTTNAINYTVSSFVLGDDWLPPTGVPYTSGLA